MAQHGSLGSIRIRYQQSAPSSGNFRAYTALFLTDPPVVRGEKSGNGGGALIVIQRSKHRARSTKHLLHGYLAHKNATPPCRGTSLIKNNPPHDPTVALFLGTYCDAGGWMLSGRHLRPPHPPPSPPPPTNRNDPSHAASSKRDF